MQSIWRLAHDLIDNNRSQTDFKDVLIKCVKARNYKETRSDSMTHTVLSQSQKFYGSRVRFRTYMQLSFDAQYLHMVWQFKMLIYIFDISNHVS